MVYGQRIINHKYFSTIMFVCLPQVSKINFLYVIPSVTLSGLKPAWLYFKDKLYPAINKFQTSYSLNGTSELKTQVRFHNAPTTYDSAAATHPTRVLLDSLTCSYDIAGGE